MSPPPPSVRHRHPLKLPGLLVGLALLGACAPQTPPPQRTALPPPPPSGTAAAAAQPTAAVPRAAGTPTGTPTGSPTGTPTAPSSATIAACRAEAERAAVTQNRGDLMRLDARDRDLAMPNTLFAEQARGFAQQDRDRLFRECMTRASNGATRIP
jgi:hypothetical protein